MSKGNSDGEESQGKQNVGPKEQSRGKAESVKTAINLFEIKLAGGEMKPTVGEYIRLLELQKDSDEDELREIKVTWVEPVETESSDKI